LIQIKSAKKTLPAAAVALNVIDILQDCKLFSQVPGRSFARLVAMGRLVKFRKGQTIFRAGDDCPGMYVVGKGVVRVFNTAAGGKEHVLHLVEPGGTFAEVAAMGNFSVPAHAEAVAPTVCALLPLAAFRREIEQDHELCLGMLASLTMWVRHLVNLMEDVVLRDAAGRIARYLLATEPAADGSVALPSLKRHVASHLNLTSETFSRTLRRLEDAGLIAEPHRNRVKVLDVNGLRRVAEGLYPRL